MSEYVELVPEDRECDDHPADLPLWPVGEVRQYFYAVRIEDEEIDIDERNSYVLDKECEEFILGERRFGECLLFRYVSQSKYRTKECTRKYHPIHKNLILLEHATQIKERKNTGDSYRTEQHHSTSGDDREEEDEAGSVEVSVINILVVFPSQDASYEGCNEEQTQESCERQ